MEYEDLIDVVTPEGVGLELRLAGLGSRVIALGLDWVVRIVGLLVILGAMAIAGVGYDLRVIVEALLTFAAYYLYDILFEAYGAGRTPGKRWTSLRVLRSDGRPVGLGTAALRNVVRTIDGPALAYIPGVISIVATKRNQRLGDLAAGTIVVREPRAPKDGEEPDTSVVRPPGALPAWDVTGIGAQELAAVREFLSRREAIAADARQELAARLAGGLAARIPGVPPPVDPERFLETLVELKATR